VARIEIVGSDLVVHVEGIDSFLAFKSEMRVPLAHITGVFSAREELQERPAFQVPGWWIPGVMIIGTFFRNDWSGKAFWDVHDIDKSIAVYLSGEDYTKMVIEVDDPEAATREIIRAVATPR
jgi:hypothetical protein